jgi:diaminohydroxyphosphoribosylaminopyrimidine deaminase / 5-amino-6-(5-phosphoribosylamino)uracil reductase
MRAYLRALFCAPRNSFEGVAVMMDMSTAMRRANKLSEAGLGMTAPNPIVGALILDANGREIASGFHSGGDHAEIVAISDAKSRGFTDFSQCSMVVTLEPCNHQGKTGPCSKAIIHAGFKRVAFAVSDPNPVAQGGAVTLRSAGVEVVAGIEEEKVEFTNRAWLKKIKSERPWIITKIAATLDGKIAASDGTSQWITSDNARRDVALLRNQSDAIITSTATVLADNPDLTPRFENGINPSGRLKNPVRVVMGERVIPSEFAVHSDKAETRFINSHNFTSLIEMAQDSGWNQIMIEAGSTFNSALIRAGLVDEIVLYQAPSLFGAGKNFVSDLGVDTLNDRITFNYGEIVKVGKDLRIQLLKEISKDLNLEGAR